MFYKSDTTYLGTESLGGLSQVGDVEFMTFGDAFQFAQLARQCSWYGLL